MQVNGYVEGYDERNCYSQWKRIAEFAYSDDAIAFAKQQAADNKAWSFRAFRCHEPYGNMLAWHSDEMRPVTY